MQAKPVGIEPGLGGAALEAEFHEGGVNSAQSETLIGQIEPLIDSLEVPDVGPQALSFEVNGERLTISIEVDNSMPHMFEIGQNGKVLKINLSLIRERFGTTADIGLMAKAIILHELADALGMQLGYSHNTRHTASLTLEGLLAQKSPEIRNMLVPLWQARPVAFGAGDIAGAKAVAEVPVTTPSVALAPMTSSVPLAMPPTIESPAVSDRSTALAPGIDSIETRQATTTEAFNTDFIDKDNDVILVMGVPTGIDAEGNDADHALSQTMPKINNNFATKGYGIRENNKQVVTFKMDGNKTEANQKAAMDYALSKVSAKGRIILCSPQMENGPQLAKDAAQKTYKGHGNVTVIADAYTDLNRGKNIPPDIMIRMVLARNIAFCISLQEAGKEGALAEALNSTIALLAKVANNDLSGVKDLNDLLKKLNDMALRIKPIDFKTITDWQRSQEAVATAL